MNQSRSTPKKKTTFETVTEALYEALLDLVDVTAVAFSRQSLIQKQALLGAGFNPWQVNRTMKRFEKRGIITTKGEKIKVTDKGFLYLRRHELNAIDFTPNAHRWDGLWRILIFDIPEKDRFLRNELRRKLKSWDFKKLQQSVFITPHDCVKEITQVCDILSLQPFVHMITTPSMGDLDSVFRTYYGLKKK